MAAFGAGGAGREALEVVGAAGAEAATGAEGAAGGAESQERKEPNDGVKKRVESEAGGKDGDGKPELLRGLLRLMSARCRKVDG